MTADEFKDAMGLYVTFLGLFKNKSPYDIEVLFYKKFEEITSLENKSGEHVALVEIRPTLKYLFDNRETFGDAFDMLTVACPDLAKGIIGNLWGADVQVVKELPCLAKFTGTNGTVVFLGKSTRQKEGLKIVDPYARFRNLEFDKGIMV